MTFAEKLNYLFEISHSEGRELAASINVTPPQISKMRRGVRGLPRNEEAGRAIAEFFAKRCLGDFQLDSLSVMLNLPQIRLLEDDNVLTRLLLDWLSNDRSANSGGVERTQDFLRQFSAPFEPQSRRSEASILITPEKSSFYTFFGNDGRREAVMRFLQYLCQLRQGFVIDLLTDMNIDWANEKPEFSNRLQSSLMRLVEQGCIFRRVAAPISDMDQAFESINRWFNLYMAGKASTYYYRRMRDNVNHSLIYVVPNVAAMFAFSVGSTPSENPVTFFTTDKPTVNAMAEEFEHYLSLCDSITKSYSTDSSSAELLSCTLEYESCRTDCIQRSNSLSVVTMPWHMATSLNPGCDPQRKNEFLASFAQRYKRFKENLELYSFTDIIRVAQVDDVMSGSVPIPAGYLFDGKQQYYTPEAYASHLRGILFLLEHNANYHVELRPACDDDRSIVYVKEGRMAVLTRETYPFSVFVITEHHLVDNFAEYLRRFSPQGMENENRRDVAAKLRAVIAELDRRILEKKKAKVTAD